MPRLRMSNADYVAIAVSPALVMALVGSLVFFLIEVLYVGDYTARLNYVFGLFVFATVLIARIAIEMGSERAAAFSLPLGLLMFMALARFVEHQSSLGWAINIGLLGGVWWASHKLTWDCTVIDDSQDSSGAGLLKRIGVDSAEAESGTPENAAAAQSAVQKKSSLWRRLASAEQGPHTPGLWVLYFSLAALPLFGIGQHWIPPGDVNRRRYAFGLLAVYVASGLSLLVTTSFLGLRRYLRQRNVEMPTPMAATWVTVGGALILVVMAVASLLPRPAAEYALAQPPWRSGSTTRQRADPISVGNEGTDDSTAENREVSDNQADAPLGEAASSDADRNEQEATASDADDADKSRAGKEGQASEDDSDSSDDASSKSPERTAETSDRHSEEKADDDSPSEPSNQTNQESPQSSDERPSASTPRDSQLTALVAPLASSVGALVKAIAYALLFAAIAYLAWRYRHDVVRGFLELIQMLRELIDRLLGRARPAVATLDAEEAATPASRRTFAEFPDPFLSGRDRTVSPVELVRYTFEAFEAWSSDRGHPRTADLTPQEFLRIAAPPDSSLHAEARRLVRLYNQAAYASAQIPRQAADELHSLWHLMHALP